jgi:hypothetical protein
MNHISIIACGESGSQWDGQGVSIGVNDCWKFGKPTTYLLCVQTIQQMTPPRQPKERLKTIIESKPEKFYTHKKEWERFFKPDVLELINITKWKGRLTGQVQFSRTSPFIALILAHNLGFDHMKLYGADFNTHRDYSPGQSSSFLDEMKNYKFLFQHLQHAGVTIECTKESYLNNFL